MTDDDDLHGGCVCGAIRYEVRGSPAMVAYCHCSDCRRSGGSVVAVLAGFPGDGFRMTGTGLACYSATAGVKRSFCGNCGTPLFYENQSFPENIYIHIGSFDQPENLPPDRHTWVSERISWHQIKDDLKQYDELSNAGLPDNTPPYETSGW